MKTGLRLGSPVCVHPDNAWMKAFMQGVAERKLRVDFICMHSYGGPGCRWAGQPDPGDLEDLRRPAGVAHRVRRRRLGSEVPRAESFQARAGARLHAQGHAETRRARMPGAARLVPLQSQQRRARDLRLAGCRGAPHPLGRIFPDPADDGPGFPALASGADPCRGFRGRSAHGRRRVRGRDLAGRRGRLGRDGFARAAGAHPGARYPMPRLGRARPDRLPVLSRPSGSAGCRCAARVCWPPTTPRSNTTCCAGPGPGPRRSPPSSARAETVAEWGPWIDTCRLARAWAPSLGDFRLGQLVADLRLGPRLEALAAQHCPPKRRRFHCALYDALAAALVLRALCALEGRSQPPPFAQLVRDSVSAPAANDLMQGELGL